MSEPWRKHLAAMGKDPAASPAAMPLFAPVIFGAAAQIEAVSVHDMLDDATLMDKCLNGTRKLLGLDCIYVTVPSSAELEAAAKNNADTAAEQPRLAAGIELCRRLSKTEGASVALLAGLTGPATLARQLMQGQDVDDQEDFYEQASACLLALVKALGEAGCNAVWFQETAEPGEEDDEREIWEDSLTPIINVARFHKLPVFLSFTEAEPRAWPQGVIACSSNPSAGAAAVLPADCQSWDELPRDCQLVLTQGEIDPSTKLAELRERVALLTG